MADLAEVQDHLQLVPELILFYWEFSQNVTNLLRSLYLFFRVFSPDISKALRVSTCKLTSVVSPLDVIDCFCQGAEEEGRQNFDMHWELSPSIHMQVM